MPAVAAWLQQVWLTEEAELAQGQQAWMEPSWWTCLVMAANRTYMLSIRVKIDDSRE